MDEFVLFDLEIQDDCLNCDLVLVKASNFVNHYKQTFLNYNTHIPEIMNWIEEYSIWSHVGWRLRQTTVRNNHKGMTAEYAIVLVIHDPAQAIFFKTRWWPLREVSGACQ